MILKALLQWDLECSPTTWTHISQATAINRFAHINNINLSERGAGEFGSFCLSYSPSLQCDVSQEPPAKQWKVWPPLSRSVWLL